MSTAIIFVSILVAILTIAHLITSKAQDKYFKTRQAFKCAICGEEKSLNQIKICVPRYVCEGCYPRLKELNDKI